LKRAWKPADRYDFAKENCKLILALREDFLPDLEGLRRRMPSIMDNRMRLTRMDGRQARDVILAPGSHLVAPGVTEKVIAFVAASRGRPGEETVSDAELAGLEIEPALLSIVCRELNNKRIRLGQPQITADLLEGAQQEIVAQFYESSLAGIDPALKLFIEEQLLTSEGYRDTRPLAEALQEPRMTRADIDKLVARRLLRIEERFGTQWVELTHDLLTGVSRQQRDLRREQTQAAQEAEARAQAERERAERAEAEAARERAERARRQRWLAMQPSASRRLAAWSGVRGSHSLLPRSCSSSQSPQSSLPRASNTCPKNGRKSSRRSTSSSFERWLGRLTPQPLLRSKCASYANMKRILRRSLRRIRAMSGGSTSSRFSTSAPEHTWLCRTTRQLGRKSLTRHSPF
jgi:hypothetical protein